MAAKRGSQKAVLKWNILPGAVQQHQDLCSPLFNKFARKWRMHLRKQEVSLEYSQELDQIVAFVRYTNVIQSYKFHFFIKNSAEQAALGVSVLCVLFAFLFVYLLVC